MKIYFVRHGESVGNASAVHQTTEMPLSEMGRQQAEKITKRLKNIKIDLIFASPVTRAKETAEIISASLGIPVEEREELAEAKGPSEIRGMSVKDPEARRVKEIIREHFFERNWKYSDEESFDDLNARTETFLQHIIKNHGDKDLLCVSHATLIKFLVTKMAFGDKLTPEIFHIFFNHFWTSNTGLTVCEYEEDHGWWVRHFNDASHL
jgi:broad specificity phosphatase PhoE